MIMSLNLTWERVETCLLVVMVTEYYYVINKYCQVNTYFKQGFLLHYIKIFSLKIQFGLHGYIHGYIDGDNTDIRVFPVYVDN